MPKLTVFHHCYKIQRWNDVEKSSRLSATHNVGNMMFQLYAVNYYARKNPFDFLLYFYDDIQNRRNRDTSCSGVKRAFLTKLILSRFYEQPWKDLNFLNGYSIGFCVLRSSLTFFFALPWTPAWPDERTENLSLPGGPHREKDFSRNDKEITCERTLFSVAASFHRFGSRRIS